VTPKPEEASMTDPAGLLEPGMLVRNPERPDWGVGQVQSNIGGRVTVNFENEGKLVIDASLVALEMVYDP